MIENFFKDKKELLEKEASNVLFNMGKNVVAGPTHVASGVALMKPKLNSKLLQSFNDSTYVAEAYKFFKTYTDLNINMITIITFSANIREIILNALSFNS